jgi:protein CpxP
MKLKFGFFLTLMIAAVFVANAQGGSRRTIEERVQAAHAKMDSAFKLDTEKQVKADSAFANYYRQQDKIREEMRSGGERPDFQAMREKMQPALDARDKELKALFTDEQFKKWKEEIEPAMMQRRGGGGNRQ